jgi:hypothetical protein
VDEPDEREHRADGRGDGGVEKLLLEDVRHHRAEDQADEYRALAEGLEPFVDDACAVERLHAHLGCRRTCRVQRVVDEAVGPLRKVGQNGGDHRDGVQSRYRLKCLCADQKTDVEQNRHDRGDW